MKSNESIDIVLAEDDFNILLSLEFILESKGFSLELAQNGKEALDKIISLKPKVAILDYMMPELTGLEVTQKIKKELDLDIYVILLTARSADEDIKQAKEAGADTYLCKPYNPDKLLEIVSKVLKKGE